MGGKKDHVERPSIRFEDKNGLKKEKPTHDDPGRDRTCNLLIRSQTPCHWATRPSGSRRARGDQEALRDSVECDLLSTSHFGGVVFWSMG